MSSSILSTPRRRRWAATVLTAVATAGILAGCGNDDAAPLTITDQWVKAAPSGMTAAFGTLTNNGTQTVRVVSASSPSAGRTEIHEVVPVAGAMQMRPKQGGLAIPPGGTATLKPGGDHIMLFDLPKPVTAGQNVSITLVLGDGTSVDFTAQARDFPGANESYGH
ncbi:copper chaperone PCu(A)C [Gordonia crocea]|uniref:Lipoprotein n=1 Tax=Gordonia crocea TaxID=589162 RepID=A0A7M3SV54_9ACTN|nr:copper chaperone PCu(A)C [Gordonia crocea]GED96528.1 hypothetical protein nbrc107697_05670 [Gordonia crocea]